MKRPLASELKSNDVETRLSALRAAAGKDDSLTIELLLSALADSEWRVRKVAVEMLSLVPDRPRMVLQLIDRIDREKNIGMRNAAIEIFIRFGGESVDPTLSRLSGANDDIRKCLIDTLGEIRDLRVKPVLIAHLADRNENVAASAVEALGKLKDPEGVEPLLRMLSRESSFLVFSAIKALEQIGDSRAVEPLIPLLKSDLYRRAVVETLGVLGDLRGLSPLIELVRSGPKGLRAEKMHRQAALKAIVALESKQGEADCLTVRDAIKGVRSDDLARFFLETLGSLDPSLKRAAIQVIGWIGAGEGEKSTLITHEEVSALIPFVDGEYREEVIGALTEIGREAIGLGEIGQLTGGLSIREDPIREGIAIVLGKIGDRRAVPALLSLLKDRNAAVRRAAVAALGQIRDCGTVHALLSTLMDGEPTVRENAVGVLLEMKESLPLPILLEFLRDESSFLRCHAAFLLGRMGSKEALPSLILLLKDPEEEVRKAAVEALDSFDDPESTRRLFSALGDERADVRRSALKVLARREMILQDEEAESLRPLIRDDDIWVRSAISLLLSRARGKKGLDLLLELLGDPIGAVKIAALSALSSYKKEKKVLSRILKEAGGPDPDVRQAAVSALGTLEDRSVVPFLRKFLSDPSWIVRREAIRALGRLHDFGSIPRLNALADSDPDRMVCEAAREVLSLFSAEGKL
ncbi:MAG: HEAT repeat domain-containing protein [Candidatus Manganitrophaceae bacterium]